jgi:hypothetical protein
MHSIAPAEAIGKIVVGVDTHKHLHVAVALDRLVLLPGAGIRGRVKCV